MFHICLHICNICRIIYLTHVCLFSGNAQTCACNTYGVVYLSVLFVELICFLFWIHCAVLRFQNVLYMRKANDLHIITHQMFYMCKSNDGMSHGNKTVSVHMEFIMFTWFVYHSRPPTHIRKDTCNIYAPYMQNISLFASWYMIHIW